MTSKCTTEVPVALRMRDSLPSYMRLAKIKKKAAEPQKKFTKIKYYTVEKPLTLVLNFSTRGTCCKNTL